MKGRERGKEKEKREREEREREKRKDSFQPKIVGVYSSGNSPWTQRIAKQVFPCSKDEKEKEKICKRESEFPSKLEVCSSFIVFK